MNASQRSAALALLLLVTGCGGGSSTMTVLTPPHPTNNARAQASITIRYPQSVLRLNSAAADGRRPLFVDSAASVIVFHDDDGKGNATDVSVNVAPRPDGSQTVNLPIVAGNSTLSVAQCFASTNPCSATVSPPYTFAHLTSNYDAFGSTVLSGVGAGTTFQAAVTLYMVVAGIGITTTPTSGFTSRALSSNVLAPTPWQNCSVSFASYTFAFDNGRTYIIGSATGVGGIPQPQLVSQASDNGGTSRLSVDPQGVIRVQFDAAHNGVTGHFQTFDINPADRNFLMPTADGYVDFLYQLC